MARRRGSLLPVAAVLVLAAALNLWVLNHPARIDLTSGGVYSIGDATRRVLEGLERPVDIVFFYDLRSRAMQDARYLLEQYAAFSPLVRVTSHDPQLEPAAAAREGVQFAGTTVMRSGDRRVIVNGADEVEFTNGLIRVSSDAVGVICFTDGHVESNPMSLQTHDHFEGGAGAHGHSHSSGGRPLTLHERHGMGMAKNALEILGYRVEQRRLLSGPQALEGCTVVVVASPQQAFTAREAAALDAALAAGMPMLFMLEPGIVSGLDEVLARRGIRVTGELIRDPAQHYWTDPATPAVTDYTRHRVTRRLALTFYPGATELRPVAGGLPPDIHVVPLVESSAASLSGPSADASPAARTLALLASSPARGLRMAVVGDGDFATNSFYGALGNGQLFLNLVSELAEQGNLLDIAPREYQLGELRMTNAQLRATFLLTTVLGPLALVALAAWTAWRRR
ncbi:MAG: Gldg family protein [Gammaproteobacteria bacterium]|nr:Gldg family protein [Gammaproteobacteria bacterium]MCP5199133.1 Gldg family protein [Gammaproteobacteria bacterium]